jgi:hypothetical protein
MGLMFNCSVKKFPDMELPRETIPQKTLTLDPYPETNFSTPIKKAVQKQQLVNRLEPAAESQFHIFRKNADKQVSNTYSNPDNTAHSAIQSSWAAFTGMSDGQRNQMLKGILSKCSSKQVDYICTLLNLKMVGDSNKLHVIIFIPKRQVVPGELAHKYQSKKKLRQGEKVDDAR